MREAVLAGPRYRGGVRVGGREITVEEERLLRNRALVGWRLSARGRPGGREAVSCGLYEHAGQPYMVVAGEGGKVLAWFRLVSRRECLLLRPVPLDEVPASVDALTRSAWLRGLSQTLLARSSALRAHQALALSRAEGSHAREDGTALLF